MVSEELRTTQWQTQGHLSVISWLSFCGFLTKFLCIFQKAFHMYVIFLLPEVNYNSKLL